MTTRSIFTTTTPLPPCVKLETVIELLHSHMEMIKLNPSVTNFQRCKPPMNAPADEHDFSWYEITEKVPYLPCNLLSRDVTFKACFYNLPMGLQTHVYAPMGLDIREMWTVKDNMARESTGKTELSLAEDESEGLYLKEDIEMQCNVLMTSFVKKTLKAAHAPFVGQLILKLEPSTE
ncbi:hypothetical protein N7486_004203 [Penicillium sp. IBT 16267x]|nr:hypothetical protein N7486_004203 [Penicillium sp. IBT 16267x]